MAPVVSDVQARLAQSVEHETLNLGVVGSSPTLGEFFFYWKNKKNSLNSFGDFWETSQGVSSQGLSQVAIFNNNINIEKQIDFFKTLILQDDLITKICNNSEFWRKFQDKMPTLYSLALILENIPSTSAQIERFFSITGIICDKKRLRMTHEMIIMRSMLKANISILEELNNKN